jgi:hypothetical protein
MKEDNNNIKMLIAAILKLSLKLSKCNTSAKAPDAPKTSAKAAKAPKTSAKAPGAPKTSAKAAKAPKTSAKAAAKTSAKAAPKTVMRKIIGGGSAEFFE